MLGYLRLTAPSNSSHVQCRRLLVSCHFVDDACTLSNAPSFRDRSPNPNANFRPKQET
jgi:hypothetical protein